MTEHRVLVCGSRSWRDVHEIERHLNSLVEWCAGRGLSLVVIDRDGRGADWVACSWASRCANRYANGSTVSVSRDPYPADWNRYGKVAGPIRNQQMLNEGRPHRVLAFIDKPLSESRGTAHMVSLAKAAGIPVEIHERQPGRVIRGEVIDHGETSDG